MSRLIALLTAFSANLYFANSTKNDVNGTQSSPFSNDYLCTLSDRPTIVHLFEWKWTDIANECEDFLSQHGYGAVQISPPTEHLWRVVDINGKGRLDVPWYVRYQPVGYGLHSRSGTEEEFKLMVERCNAVGVRIIVDVVLNHMAGAGQAGTNLSVSGKTFFNSTPLHEDFPAAGFNASHFNDARCNRDIQGDDYRQHAKSVRNCRLVGLVDLNNGHPHVRDQQVKLLNQLLDYGVVGFRFDASKHMWPADLEAIITQLKPVKKELCGGREGLKPFIVHEVIDKGGEAIGVKEYTQLGRYTNFNYGIAVSNALQGWDNKNLASLADLNRGYAYGNLASHDVLNFIDNHDDQRYEQNHLLTYKKAELYKLGVAFMLGWPYGIPRVMSSYRFDHNDQGPPSAGASGQYKTNSVTFDERGQCTGAWVCEHRWPEVAAMAKFRSLTKGKAVALVHKEHNVLAFARLGRGYFAANNIDEEKKIKVPTSMPPGIYCNMYTKRNSSATEEAWQECASKEQITVDSNGDASIRIPKRSVVTFTMGSRLLTQTPIANKSKAEENEGHQPLANTTVIFLKKATNDGDNLFLRGGTFNASDCNIKESVAASKCSITIHHIIPHATNGDSQFALVYEAYTAWTQGDSHLDYFGAEPGQGTNHGMGAGGTPMRYSSGDENSSTFNALNKRLALGLTGYWMVELEVDCAKNAQFEVKGFLNGEWEPRIAPSAPLSNATTHECGGTQSGNHLVQCGVVNVFEWGETQCSVKRLEH